MPGFVLATLLLVSHGVSPDPAPVELQWEVPDSCPPEETVLRRIEALIGRPLQQVRAQALRVEGQIQRTEAGHHLRLTIATASGEDTHTFEAPRCGELAEISAIMVAITIDPTLIDLLPEQPGAVAEAVLRTYGGPAAVPAPAPEPMPSPPAEPTRPAPPPSQDAAPEPTAPGIRTFIALEPGLGLLALPAPTFAIHASAGIDWRWLRWALSGAYWLEQNTRVQASAPAGGTLELWWLGTRLCAKPGVSIVEFPLCAGLQLGAMHGRGIAVPRPESARIPWVAAELRTGLWVAPWPMVAFGVANTVMLPITRPRFVLVGMGQVHRTPALSDMVTLGIELRFPWPFR